MTEQNNGKREEANRLVKKYTGLLGAAGIIPVPLVELAVVPGFQLKMVRDLSNLYGLQYSESLVKSVLASITGVGFVMASTRVVSSVLKGIPGIGQISGVLSSTVLGGTSTYAIGKVFIEHFETGGTLLSMDADKMKAHYESILNAPPPKKKPKPVINYSGVKP